MSPRSALTSRGSWRYASGPRGALPSGDRHRGTVGRRWVSTNATSVNLPVFGTLVPVSQTPVRVVIAEDEALIRLDLKEMLQEEGYEVAGEAADGEQAIELAASLRPDLLILDVKMPVLDGISAAEQIAANHIAPVVILTAFSQ